MAQRVENEGARAWGRRRACRWAVRQPRQQQRAWPCGPAAATAGGAEASRLPCRQGQRPRPMGRGLAGPQRGTEGSALKDPVPQVEGLAESFSVFSEFGLQLLRGLRDYFPATNSKAVSRLELLLKWVQPCTRGGAGHRRGGPSSRRPLRRCLGKLQLFQPSFEVRPFETGLNMDIAAALKVCVSGGRGRPTVQATSLLVRPRHQPVSHPAVPHPLPHPPSAPPIFWLHCVLCREATANGTTGS